MESVRIAENVIRAAYGIFYVFPDTNLINNTVVTVPFVDNITLFNDRPPAAPTRTSPTFFRGRRSQRQIPTRDSPAHSGLWQGPAILPASLPSSI